MQRDVIIKGLGKPSFKKGWPETELLEYWATADSKHRDLSYRFDQRGLAYQIQGGTPQLDGIDVSSWSLDQIESKLGPADRDGRLSEQTPHYERHHQSDTKFLAYPEHQLLVRHDKEHGVDFILFCPPSSDQTPHQY